MPFWDFRQIASQVLSGLDYLHKFGWAHRDIKPENVVITADLRAHGSVQLIDFGLSCQDHSKFNWAGTANYMAPEYLSLIGDSKTMIFPKFVSYYATDIWSCGIMFLELQILGHFPPDGRFIGKAIEKRNEWEISAIYDRETQSSSGSDLSSWQGHIPFSELQRQGLFASTFTLIEGMLHYDPKMRKTAKECRCSEVFVDNIVAPAKSHPVMDQASIRLRRKPLYQQRQPRQPLALCPTQFRRKEATLYQQRQPQKSFLLPLDIQLDFSQQQHHRKRKRAHFEAPQWETGKIVEIEGFYCALYR